MGAGRLRPGVAGQGPGPDPGAPPGEARTPGAPGDAGPAPVRQTAGTDNARTTTQGPITTTGEATTTTGEATTTTTTGATIR